MPSFSGQYLTVVQKKPQPRTRVPRMWRMRTGAGESGAEAGRGYPSHLEEGEGFFGHQNFLLLNDPALLTSRSLAEMRVEPLDYLSFVVGRVFRAVKGRPVPPAFDPDQLHWDPRFLKGGFHHFRLTERDD